MFKVVLIVLLAANSCLTEDVVKAGIHHPNHMMGHQVLISPTFYARLLLTQIPKAQKD
jgi:hypothetical protein